MRIRANSFLNQQDSQRLNALLLALFCLMMFIEYGLIWFQEFLDELDYEDENEETIQDSISGDVLRYSPSEEDLT